MKNDKQQQAHNLYFQTNLSQTQIAKMLDVDRKTLFNWMADGNWRQLKKSANHIPAKIVEQHYYMLANLNYEILSRAHQPYPLTHEGKQMRYLSLCIKDLKNKQTVNESIEAFTHLSEHIARTDPDFAAGLRPYIQDYISGRAKVKFAECVPEDLMVSPKMDEMFDYEIRPEDDDDPNFQSFDTNNDGGQPAPDEPCVTSPLAAEASSAKEAATEPAYFSHAEEELCIAQRCTPFSGSQTTEAPALFSTSTSAEATPADPYVTPPSPPERAGVRPLAPDTAPHNTATQSPPSAAEASSAKEADDLDAELPQPNTPAPTPTTPTLTHANASPANCKIRQAQKTIVRSPHIHVAA